MLTPEETEKVYKIDEIYHSRRTYSPFFSFDFNGNEFSKIYRRYGGTRVGGWIKPTGFFRVFPLPCPFNFEKVSLIYMENFESNEDDFGSSRREGDGVGGRLERIWNIDFGW